MRLAFTEFDLDVAASLANHAALALDRADARLVRARTSTLEDRDRIARDLHDHVVQRLFAAGLNIQSVCAALGPGAAADRLSDQVDEIDATIRQIRTTIFGLHVARGGPVGVRAPHPRGDHRGRVDPVRAARGELPRAARPAGLGGRLRRRGRGGARGAHQRRPAREAQRAEVMVSADSRAVDVEVLDDGRGVGKEVTLSGLANLRKRAEVLGGIVRDHGPKRSRNATALDGPARPDRPVARTGSTRCPSISSTDSAIHWLCGPAGNQGRGRPSDQREASVAASPTRCAVPVISTDHPQNVSGSMSSTWSVVALLCTRRASSPNVPARKYAVPGSASYLVGTICTYVVALEADPPDPVPDDEPPALVGAELLERGVRGHGAPACWT